MKQKMPKTEAEWKKKLTPEQYAICRLGATESPFSGKYAHHKEKGMYVCAACGQELFPSDTKFESGTGWPSFWDAVDKKNVELREDLSLGMKRIEVRCGKCKSHLGHLFDDGPTTVRRADGTSVRATGQRYCINS